MRYVIVPISFLALASCSPKALQEIPGNEARASVVLISEEDQENYLTDYFPSVELFDSLVAGPGLALTHVTDTTFVINPYVQLSTLDCWRGGKKLTLVVEDGRNFNAGYAHLYTTGFDAQSNRLTIGFTQKPETVVALWQNTKLPAEDVMLTEQEIVVKLPSLPKNSPERTFIRVYAATADSPMSDICVPLQHGCVVTDVKELNRHDPETQILYSLMIDRFNNGNPANDWQYNRPEEVLPQADYQGGDVKGITEKINSGFFDDLGINTIWISPITQNPYDVWGQYHNPDTKFTGYHGYWPIYITKVEERFATDDELHEMLQTAHQHEINVILDYVANHLHIKSPLFQAHPDWATDSLTAEGLPNLELWDGDYRLTTWFDKHIPSLNLERRDVADQLTDSALFWIRNFEFDGYRHDACKHIPLNYWRTFTRKLKIDPRLRDRSFWMIGETYGSPALINSYVKSGMLNAQFDFNYYHTAIDVLAKHNDRPMTDLARVIEESAAAYGSHHTMGNISGNHDKPRFISLAGGDLSWDEDSKAAGWNRSIGIGDSAVGYAKSLLLEKLNLTLPGVPCIYQGDEYGQPGANDPDNRRMMRFGSYNEREQHHLDEVKQFARLRRQNIALQFGDYLPLYCSNDVLIFLRIYLGKGFLVALNCGETPFEGTVDLPQGIAASGQSSPLAVSVSPNDVICLCL